MVLATLIIILIVAITANALKWYRLASKVYGKGITVTPIASTHTYSQQLGIIKAAMHLDDVYIVEWPDGKQTVENRDSLKSFAANIEEII